mmetsp:Transcript_19676/g.62572  ORF Transcript_19676/g.62572 Transcript_19676/m.62572 type:complete len:285 (+) Transcript_19676:2352-3206(+)
MPKMTKNMRHTTLTFIIATTLRDTERSTTRIPCERVRARRGLMARRMRRPLTTLTLLDSSVSTTMLVSTMATSSLLSVLVMYTRYPRHTILIMDSIPKQAVSAMSRSLSTLASEEPSTSLGCSHAICTHDTTMRKNMKFSKCLYVMTLKSALRSQWLGGRMNRLMPVSRCSLILTSIFFLALRARSLRRSALNRRRLILPFLPPSFSWLVKNRSICRWLLGEVGSLLSLAMRLTCSALMPTPLSVDMRPKLCKLSASLARPRMSSGSSMKVSMSDPEKDPEAPV